MKCVVQVSKDLKCVVEHKCPGSVSWKYVLASGHLKSVLGTKCVLGNILRTHFQDTPPVVEACPEKNWVYRWTVKKSRYRRLWRRVMVINV